MSKYKYYIYLATPFGSIGGGMYKVVDYLIQHQSIDDEEGYAKLILLNTRGSGKAFTSSFTIFSALFKVIYGRLSGNLVGVHVNMAERLSIYRKGILILFCRLIGLPVILHLHAARIKSSYTNSSSLNKVMTRFIFKIASHCIVLGHAAESFCIEELKLDSSKLDIVINGVPAPSVTRRVRQHNSKFRVLFLGNLTERKGVSDLLHALTLPGFKIDELVVTFAGGGDVHTYQKLATELGLSHCTEFLGWVDQAKIYLLLANADVLILPSYDEGLPLVILEALANGVAVICTPIAEIPYVLTDSVNACFVNPGDIHNIADSLQKIISDDMFRKVLEENGRIIYYSKFSIDRFFSNISIIHKRYFGYCAKPIAQYEIQNDAKC